MRDDAGRAVLGEPGEIVVRGPNTSVGFFADPERTAAVFEPDGWVRSGDLGVLDDDGYLRIVGRKKEIIIRGGLNIAPREIEDLVIEHPAVAETAVVGLPHPRLGEMTCACVVLREGAALELDELTGFLREHGMATYKLPQRLVALDALPRTPSGKVKKFELEAQLEGGRRVSAPKSFLDTGLDWSSEGFTPQEKEQMLKWYAENHESADSHLSKFPAFWIEHDPGGFKRYRRYMIEIDTPRDGVVLPQAAHLLMYLYLYTVFANEKGILYLVINSRALGARRAEVVDVFRIAALAGGPFGINAAAELADEYLRAWPDPGDEPGIPWPDGWAPRPEALRSGIDHGSNDLTDEELERLRGVVPRGLRRGPLARRPARAAAPARPQDAAHQGRGGRRRGAADPDGGALPAPAGGGAGVAEGDGARRAARQGARRRAPPRRRDDLLGGCLQRRDRARGRGRRAGAAARSLGVSVARNWRPSSDEGKKMDLLEQLKAAEDIRQLKARYFRLMDTKDWDALADVFAHDAVMDMTTSGADDAVEGPLVTTGRDAIIAFMRGAVEDALTVHHGHMPEIQVTSDTTATGIWALEDRIWFPPGAPVQDFWGYGHYHDEYAKSDDGVWRITRTAVTRLRLHTA